MSVEFEYNNGTLTAKIKGDIDHYTASEIRLITDGELGRTMPRLLIFDMGGVSFMDSSGIGLILGRVRTAAGWGGKVKIKNCSENIRKIIALSGLKNMITDLKSENKV